MKKISPSDYLEYRINEMDLISSHPSIFTSDLIEVMNEGLEYDIMKPSNMGSETK